MAARPDLGWYKRFPDKALAGMFELNLEQRGAYGTIIDLIYARAGELPVDVDFLKRHLQVNARVVKRLLEELTALDKIQIVDGMIRTRRSDVEIEARISTIKAQSDGGKEGAERRWNGQAQGSFSEVSAKFEQKVDENSAKTPEKVVEFSSTNPANFPETMSENPALPPKTEKDTYSETYPTRAREKESESDKESTPSTESLKSERVENPFDDDGGLISKLNALATMSGLNLTIPRNLNNALEQLKVWIETGIDYEETIVPVVKSRTVENPTEPIYSLRYFDAAIRKRHAVGLNGSKSKPFEPAKPKPPIAAEDVPDERVTKFRERAHKALNSVYDRRLAPEHVALRVDDERLLRVYFRDESDLRTAQLEIESDIERIARSLGLAATLEVLK